MITCSLCGLDESQVSFSKRQQKKAQKDESSTVKCMTCLQSSSADAEAMSQSPAGTAAPVVKRSRDFSPDENAPIPKKKRKLAHFRQLDDDDDDDSEDGDEESSRSHTRDDDHEVSLNAIKREVLGRDHLHVDTPGKVDPEDDDLARIRQLLDATPEQANQYHHHHSSASASSIATRLQSDLECAICRDILYPPVSLQCGHSFCQDCLEWWWKTSPTCPTCRGGEVDSGGNNRFSNIILPKVNLALKKCIMALYAAQVVKKIQTRRNVTAGENGGEHTRGCEVLSPLEDEFWHSIATSNNASKTVKVRRNIILDEDDQRMQVALALYQPPVQLQNGIIFSICLLTMEEDEASDSGFPALMTNVEDEHFICTNEAKFRQSLLQVEMTKEGGTVAPVARVHPEISPPGMVEFQFDASTCTFHQDAMTLRFKHEDTGAVLEVDLSLLKIGASGGSFLPLQDQQRRHQRQPQSYPSSSRQRDSMVMEDMDGEDEDEEDEGEDLDQFEDDGFLVAEEGSDVEGAFSGEEEEDDDLCCICRDGGDLMICDGGREMDGCGKSFHHHCVNRPSIPEGDWICSPCARSGGIQVEGNKGHEFAMGNEDEPKTAVKGNSRRTLEDDSSADEEDEEDDSPPKKKSSKGGAATNNASIDNKRRVIVLEDSDED